MLFSGILNPHVAGLLCRFRHTNMLVIADRGFPFWTEIETVDVSLIDDIPTVADVLHAVVAVCRLGNAWMAEEFCANNPAATRERIGTILGSTPLQFEPHVHLKRRVPRAIGLIRTGDTIPYANIVLESA